MILVFLISFGLVAMTVFYLWHTANSIAKDVTTFKPDRAVRIGGVVQRHTINIVATGDATGEDGQSVFDGIAVHSATSGSIGPDGQDDWSDFDAIVVHTYCPRWDVENLPLRGRITIREAYMLALCSGKRVILGVGNTVPGEKMMESEIYADFLRRMYGFTNVILGEDPKAIDTKSEAREIYRLCQKNGIKTVVRFGARPHIARISWYWNQVNGGRTTNYFRTVFWYWFHPKAQETIKTYFVGVYVPAYLYLFEVPFFVIDMGLQFVDLYFPKAFSRGLRNLMLRIIRRGKG